MGKLNSIDPGDIQWVPSDDNDVVRQEPCKQKNSCKFKIKLNTDKKKLSYI